MERSFWKLERVRDGFGLGRVADILSGFQGFDMIILSILKQHLDIGFGLS